MQMQQLMTFIGYTAGAVFMLLGIAFLFTDLFPSAGISGGAQIKIVFGVVMFLYGIYRILMISLKQRKRDEEKID